MKFTKNELDIICQYAAPTKEETLADESYRNAKRSEQEGEIKIKSHVAVVAGKPYPDKKVEGLEKGGSRKDGGQYIFEGEKYLV